MDKGELGRVEGQELPVSESLSNKIAGSRRRRFSRFALTALSSIPWVGGVLSAVVARDAEQEQGEVNQLLEVWVKEHEQKFRELLSSIDQILIRLEELENQGASPRTEEEEFLSLVRKGFRTWDESETKNKREIVCRLLINAGSTKLCSDDVVRLFLDWIDKYHEIHFAVIGAIYREPGISRADIWDEIGGEQVREDSAEADLFKLLIRDLSTGGIIRQQRDTSVDGQFYKKARTRRGSRVMKSAFDENELYVLTSLGKQFVHYALQEPVARLSS